MYRIFRVSKKGLSAKDTKMKPYFLGLKLTQPYTSPKLGKPGISIFDGKELHMRLLSLSLNGLQI